MGYRVYSKDYRYTAENYQIMNYGFGGSISLHLDAMDEVSDTDIGNLKGVQRNLVAQSFKLLWIDFL